MDEIVSSNRSDQDAPMMDLKEIINGKSPGLYEKLPRFVTRYVSKILHIDEMNAYLKRAKGKEGLDFAKITLEEFGVTVNPQGIENIPKEGRILLCSNHPLGGFDGMALFYVVSQIRENVLSPANDFLLYLKNMEKHFIPIAKIGSNKANIKSLDNAFNSDNTIIYFPAGLCSRKIKGEIRDLKWHKTFITRSKRSKRDVIPVFMAGRNSRRFYNLARIRKFLGLKFNVEMLYLVDEAYNLREKNIKMIFGKPIPYSTFDKRYRDNVWAEKVKSHVYDLSKNPDAIFTVE